MSIQKQLYNIIIIALFFIPVNVFGQEEETFSDKIFSFPAKARSSIDKKIKHIDASFEKEMDKQLSKIQKQENRIYRKLKRKDTAAANIYLAESKQRMSELKNKLATPGKNTEYISSLDTLKTSLQFLDTQNALSGNSKEAAVKLKSSLSKISGLEHQLYKSEELKKFMGKRKEELREQLSKFGFAKELRKINKQSYYYGEQIKAYKEILSDPKKIEQKAIALLRKTKLFRDFMSKNSMLAGLFPSAGNFTDPVAFQNSMPGLQTRNSVNDLIRQQLSAGGPNAGAAFQQNLQDAQSEMTGLKNKILGGGGNSSEGGIAEGFKPNSQKTKTFFERLEYGTNVQTQKGTNYFPVTSDVGLSAGYKLNDKSVIGIGLSCKIGWGKNWNNIRVSSEGLGLRSYMDWKIKKNLYVSGGYEQNYRSRITGIDQLKNRSAWQQSGLIGISKSLPVKTKFFKKTSMKLLWDFLSYRQAVRTQPVLFRIGYSF